MYVCLVFFVPKLVSCHILQGGVKVLVTGPWYSTTSPYTVLFDTFPVPTTLVQSGVLRCYCPGIGT